jgi:hypothetical protein
MLHLPENHKTLLLNRIQAREPRHRDQAGLLCQVNNMSKRYVVSPDFFTKGFSPNMPQAVLVVEA